MLRYGPWAIARLIALLGTFTGLASTGIAKVEIDSTFQFPSDPNLLSVNWCHVLPDGRIIAGGGKAFRLKANGSLDDSFPILTIPGDFLRKPVLEPDGGFTTFGVYADESWQQHAIGRRYTSSGAIDPNFQPDLGGTVFISRRDAAGGYLVSGQFLPGVERSGLVRLNRNGSVDQSFQRLVNFSVSGIDSTINGEWIVVGTTLTPQGFTDSDRVMRLAANGAVLSDQEREAGPSNAATTRSLLRRAARSFIFCGEGPLLGVLRFDGKLDPSFRHVWGEGPSDPSASAVARVRNGRILTSLQAPTPYFAHTKEWPLPEGEPSWPGAAVFRTLPDGMIDLSFDFNAATQPAITGAYDMAVQPDGRFIVADGARLHRFKETRSPAVFAFGEKMVNASEADRFAKCTLYRAGDVSSRGAVTVTTLGPATTARPGLDYLPFHHRIQFAPGEWKRTIVLPLRDDIRADGPKTISVKLSNPDPRSELYSSSSVTIEIADDE